MNPEYKLQHFDDSMDRCKLRIIGLHDIRTKDLISELIHAAEMLADQVATLQDEVEKLKQKP